MKVFTTKAYTFNELSDVAKETAIANHRHWNVDHNWWDFVYEDASIIAKHLGFQLGGHTKNLYRCVNHDYCHCPYVDPH